MSCFNITPLLGMKIQFRTDDEVLVEGKVVGGYGYPAGAKVYLLALDLRGYLFLVSHRDAKMIWDGQMKEDGDDQV
jgi:hypothetical protein